ncbi:hypothetical protein JTE90_001434 [Oedothorax gibbosus]|uniref:Uncharacterized protein n=1 Tax=Oedothorax gibbosus TaxID=931172 RepID=A0AAV6V099_9ARAC|nr:hypothetical protein JTE90_001434 [Oedothorax gibbosus]
MSTKNFKVHLPPSRNGGNALLEHLNQPPILFVPHRFSLLMNPSTNHSPPLFFSNILSGVFGKTKEQEKREGKSSVKGLADWKIVKGRKVSKWLK